MCGAVSDLHAADARYHKGCRVSFMSPKSTSAALKVQDEPLQVVKSVLNKDQAQIWNAFELDTLYVQNGGSDLPRRLLVTRRLEYFGDNLVAQE